MSKLDETIKKALYVFEGLPDILKYQIQIFSEELEKDKKVSHELSLWKKSYESITLGGREISGKELRNLFLQACIFKYISALKISEKSRFPVLECYNEFGEPIIEIKKLICQGENVKIFTGRFIHDRYSNGYGTERDVVIKLHESRDKKNTTEYEINIYRQLGDPSPSLGINCYLWNIPVLVMRPMKKLSKDDDEIEVGVQILRQLLALHRFTTHSDIKFDNIMEEEIEWDAGTNSISSRPINEDDEENKKSSTRRHSSHHPKENKETNKNIQHKSSKGGYGGAPAPPVYRLMDFGGCARERLGIGHKRRTWTRRWALQGRGTVMTTPKYDLLELGHTLSAVQHCRENNTSRYPKGQENRAFKGVLKRYMDYVEKIDDLKLAHQDYGPHYNALIEILLSSRNGDADRKSNHVGVGSARKEEKVYHPARSDKQVDKIADKPTDFGKLLKPIIIEEKKSKSTKTSRYSKSSSKSSSTSSTSSSSSSKGKSKSGKTGKSKKSSKSKKDKKKKK